MARHIVFRLTLLLMIGICLSSLPAQAGNTVLYDNGPISGNYGPIAIDGPLGTTVSDSFIVGGSTAVAPSLLVFGLWTLPGDSAESVDLRFSTEANGGTVLFDGVVPLLSTDCSIISGYNVCLGSTIWNFPTLEPGTYWLTLYNAVSRNNGPVGWDINNGIGCSSPGCPSQAQNSQNSLPSESFTIYTSDDGLGTPEPGSLVLLGTGVAGIVGILRRKITR